MFPAPRRTCQRDRVRKVGTKLEVLATQFAAELQLVDISVQSSAKLCARSNDRRFQSEHRTDSFLYYLQFWMEPKDDLRMSLIKSTILSTGCLRTTALTFVG